MAAAEVDVHLPHAGIPGKAREATEFIRRHMQVLVSLGSIGYQGRTIHV
ncbi:MAG: hypothetical protein LDL30_07795 [Desulfovibrio sp.]|nr:hypothetical protein [Desulfovibrio sp.]